MKGLYFQFLIEDISGEVLIGHIMDKLQRKYEYVTYNCKSFKGIGGLKPGGSAKAVKTNKLLNDLVHYLRAFDRSLQNISSCIIVVLDNDNRDVGEFLS